MIGWKVMSRHKFLIVILTAIAALSFSVSMEAGTRVSAGPASSLIGAPALDASPAPIQPAVLIGGIAEEYQGWNNCGPASLKMNLAYYGRSDTQQAIAAYVKPNPYDVNVTADELVAYARQVGMSALARDNGTRDRLKLLLSNGLPVIVETGQSSSATGGWIAHDKLLVGYDDSQFIFIDPLEGPGQKVAFDAMDADWRAINRRYVLVYPSDKETLVRAILGSDMDDAAMYANAAARARAEIAANPVDAFAHFNLGTSLNGLQQYTEAAAAFDRAQSVGLPWRMMWYQYGPYTAYLATGRYDDVTALANTTLRMTSSLEESHYYKGLALKALGKTSQARAALRAALRVNKNDLDTQSALEQFAVPG
jgi:tetratricopeptide (TPR) repeat protein